MAANSQDSRLTRLRLASDADRLHGSQMVDQADCKCHIAAAWGVAARASVAVALQAWEVPAIEAVDSYIVCRVTMATTNVRHTQRVAAVNQDLGVLVNVCFSKPHRCRRKELLLWLSKSLVTKY